LIDIEYLKMLEDINKSLENFQIKRSKDLSHFSLNWKY